MKPVLKLYSASLGILRRNEDCRYGRKVKVLATTAADAIKKAASECKKNEYVAEVQIVDRIDVE